MEKYSSDDLLKVAEASPEAIATHDKQAWLSLFSEQGIIEDPVGIAPFRRVKSGGDDDPLERFYETFIAPNEIKLNVSRNIVAGNAVVRDVNIEIKSSTGLTINVPTYVLYELVEEDGNLKVARLAAHWELFSMVKRVISRGWPGLKMMTVLGFRMLKIQGIGGVWGYMKGFFGIGRSGKNSVLSFVEALNSKNTERLVGLFTSDNSGIEYPFGDESVKPDSFVSSANGSISVSDLISAGMVTGFRFEVKGQESENSGIGLFKFDSKTRKIKSARFYF
ncbi:MAG: hypothetical protein HQ553_13020 [Chloroflexi bacterium]|nr:hypothetical protein [Chloroflexota bacterium]